MDAVARQYFGGSLPRGLRGLLSVRHRAGALALLRDVAAAGAAACASLDASVYGASVPSVRGTGFAAVLSRLDAAESAAEEEYLLLCLVWISPALAGAMGIPPAVWDDYELCSCGIARKSSRPIHRVALHPIELYHRFVLRAAHSR